MSPSETALGAPLTRAEIETFVSDWYRKLDEHVPAVEIVPMVADDVELQLPEGVLHGLQAFRGWYEGVITLFFDEVHTVRRVEVQWVDGRAQVAVVVNWQARRWRPPAPRSEWIGFDAYQRWEMIRSPSTGWPVIARYIVDELRAMPGSKPL